MPTIPPIIAGLIGLGGGVTSNIVTPTVESTLAKLDLSADGRFPTIPAGTVSKTNPYRPPSVHDYPSVKVGHPGIPPSRLPKIGTIPTSTGTDRGIIRQGKVVPILSAEDRQSTPAVPVAYRRPLDHLRRLVRRG